MGRIMRAHGLRGEVVVATDSDNPERFAPGSEMYSDLPQFPVLEVVSARPVPKGGFIVKFAQVTGREAAESLRGHALVIDRSDRRELAEGEYWPDELEGLEVRVGDDVRGRVRTVVLGTAQVRLEVELSAGGIADVPFVEALVPVVEVDAGFIEVADMEGLLTPR